jgi:hypothetical protein
LEHVQSVPPVFDRDRKGRIVHHGVHPRLLATHSDKMELSILIATRKEVYSVGIVRVWPKADPGTLGRETIGG